MLKESNSVPMLKLVEIVNRTFVSPDTKSTEEAKDFVKFLYSNVKDLKSQGI